jgi:poly-beta-1,6-N-acetyl-D-glucosamine synthase
MIQYVTLAIIFFVLFISFMWLFVFFLNRTNYDNVKIKKFPKITITIPVYNEETTIQGTLSSIAMLNYPLEKLEIFVVDDGSKDKTKEITLKFQKQNPTLNIKYIYQKNNGKASTLNNALKRASGEFFSVVDADSQVGPDSLRNVVAMFQEQEKDVASIISSMKISNLQYFLAKVQKFEYLVTIFLRQLMSDVNLLHTTHGVLCVTRINILRDVGGFDENNITEDFELAVRLRANGYKVIACKNSIVYTNVPTTFKLFWRQRIRWYRGFIETHKKFKHMIGKKNFGMFSRFQLPLNILAPIILLVAFSVMAYNVTKGLYYFLFRLVFVNGYIAALFDSIPTIKQMFLTMHLEIMIPVVTTTLIAILMATIAFNFVDDKLKNPIPMLIYLFVFPVLTMFQWVWAIYLEITRGKKQW